MLLGQRFSLHFFAFVQGDWYVHLMDIAGEELGKSVADINPSEFFFWGRGGSCMPVSKCSPALLA